MIELFTDIDEVVIDPCAGSGSTLIAAKQLNRRAYGFEIKKEFVSKFYGVLNKNVQCCLPLVAKEPPKQEIEQGKLF